MGVCIGTADITEHLGILKIKIYPFLYFFQETKQQKFTLNTPYMQEICGV